MDLVISSVIGYLIGCVMTAYIVSKRQGIDIKESGSHNMGASNVYICVGKISGVITGFFDILKGFLACAVSSILFQNPNAVLMAGVFAVIGHLYPFWLKFKGGKGLATIMGVLLYLDIRVAAIAAILIVAITLSTDYISIGTISVAVLSILYMIFIGNYAILPKLFFIFTAFIIIVKHRENVFRIIHGTEIGFLRKNKDKDPGTQKLSK